MKWRNKDVSRPWLQAARIDEKSMQDGIAWFSAGLEICQENA